MEHPEGRKEGKRVWGFLPGKTEGEGWRVLPGVERELHCFPEIPGLSRSALPSQLSKGRPEGKSW